MKKFVIISIGLFLINSTPSYAIDKDQLIQKAREIVTSVAGAEWADKIFGPSDEITLPAIPKVEKNAKEAIERKDEKASKISPEQAKKLDYAYLMELFDVTRRSKPSQKEVNDWMNVLSQGGSREGVYRGLVLDQTYYGLENFQRPVSDKVAEFAFQFMQKYLGQNTELEKLKAANFFTLKRVLTEKSLEVIDEYLKNNPEECYRWYAVFSAEMGGRFTPIWKNDLRKSSSKKEHMHWAELVPEQHLKSEVIVKLHAIFNNLQG